MRRCSFGIPLVFCFLSLSCLHATELRIQRVEFNQVDQAGGSDPWFEIAITLSVEQGEESRNANPRFTEELEVSLDFATETQPRAETVYQFYGANAVYPTLEVGRRVVRFYLPPEIVKRDRLRGEPYAWRVAVDGAGESLATLNSDSLRTNSSLAAYEARVAEGTARTTGILRLQAETPFRDASPADSPNPKLRIVTGY